MTFAVADHPTLRVRCLGLFAVNETDGRSLLSSFKKGRELVEYLAVHSSAFVNRERLIDAFWPTAHGEHLEHRLHIAACGARTMLRSVLDGFDAIVCVGGGYGFHHDLIVETDLQQFFYCANAPDVESARTGVTLYSGELFTGERADWIFAMRARCTSLYVSMLRRLALDAFAADDFQTALRYALQITELDRGNEAASRIVMRSYAALGERCAAKAEYESLSKFLAAELGVKPSPETQNARDAILNEPHVGSKQSQKHRLL